MCNFPLRTCIRACVCVPVLVDTNHFTSAGVGTLYPCACTYNVTRLTNEWDFYERIQSLFLSLPSSFQIIHFYGVFIGKLTNMYVHGQFCALYDYLIRRCDEIVLLLVGLNFMMVVKYINNISEKKTHAPGYNWDTAENSITFNSIKHRIRLLFLVTTSRYT